MNHIQWFPGHMAKARREATEKLNLVDVVIELVDARIPESSRNPMIQEIIGQKPSIIVLNKADIADNKVTNAWLEFYRSQGLPALAIDAQHQKGLKALEQECKKIMAPYFEKQKAKGVKPRSIRLMILGIPNVGKSTLINRFVGKNQAQTGNKPGVTKAQRWLKMGKEFELLDTPGILWPKFEDPKVGQNLAITGAIKDSLLHMDDLALALIEILLERHPEVLKKSFQLTADQLETLTKVEILLEITKKMGLKDDYGEASQRLIIQYRQNKLGNISLDLPIERLV
ncbi:ribosome biogenesis GTPase YlqF [Aerococcaceae bacterium DSM 109653]|uniref:Ribosome biogenesis GTPase A n=1 Tax=Fundicoccus ignavus TaxID=2664442 RepID=A0A6I2GJD6_9LACT|nr:ribosome biogenesis GTPase YlqF [Fundicoccus ignavus]MRI80438.1 ribosome biogenesis GTPase YlqF [Fundicoccus ignavus]MRI84688.1 ribosome biogenesis GTPase YlqF [Fundicoccus ignavus]